MYWKNVQELRLQESQEESTTHAGRTPRQFEVELNNENEVFTKPNWLGKEVTGILKYYNSQLSKHPYKSWKI